jgi:hypothetical protein
VRRYYFHLRNHAGRSEDEAGMLLPDRESAIRAAFDAARSIMRTPTDAAMADAWRGWQIEVVDEHGTPVLVLPFRSALLRSDPARTSDRRTA